MSVNGMEAVNGPILRCGALGGRTIRLEGISQMVGMVMIGLQSAVRPKYRILVICAFVVSRVVQSSDQQLADYLNG
jgi:hypothetical protein